VTAPPAASIFSTALFENAWAETVSFTPRSPWPRIFTSRRRFRIKPFSSSSSGVTSLPASKRARSRTFSDQTLVRKGPIGIASFEVDPRCLPMRMYAGIWPPSKPARMACEPERDFCPLIPRPE
jgi:hypothetical protein